MHPERRDRIGEVLAEALSRRPEDRAAYIASACGNDAEMAADVESLIPAAEGASGFLTTPTSGGLAPDSSASTDPDGGGPVAPATGPFEGPGTRIGPYKLLQPIGEGGFGTVFMAEQDGPVSRRVALKIIKLGMDTRQVIARFEAERQALAMMDHPNIAKVFDAGATDTGRPYFVMELVAGDPITAYCDKDSLTIPERLDLFVQVCNAVQHAHHKGVVHRDIKPSNILVNTQDGRPFAKVIDFGIAKATAARLTEKTMFTEHRMLIGTPEYMSPEQAAGLVDIDTRSDVYSLGVLLYELLTGSTPFDGGALRSAAFDEIQRIIREVEPPKPSTRILQTSDRLQAIASSRRVEPRKLGMVVRGELDWIVMKAMEKDRSRRYETADELGKDVRRHLSGEAVLAAPPSAAYRFRTMVRRNKGPVTAAALVTGALIVGLALATYGFVTASRERDEKAAALRRAVSAEGAERVQRAAAERAAAEYAAIDDFFLNVMLGAVDPDASEGKSLTVREVLDQAAAQPQSISDPDVRAAVEHQIGAMYSSLYMFKEARPHLQAAYDHRKLLQGKDRARTAETLLLLARAARLLEEPGGGEDLVRRAREVRVSVFGEESAEVAEVDLDLAQTLERKGKQSEANALVERAYGRLQRSSPQDQDSPALMSAMAYFATVLSESGKPARAADMLEVVLAANRRRYGENNSRVAKALTALGAAYAEADRADEAESSLKDALAIRRRIHPPGDPQIAAALQYLAVFTMRTRQRPADAEPMMREALEMYRARLGPQHEFVATTLVSLGADLALQNNCIAAVDVFEEAIQIFLANQPPDYWRTANARSQEGVCLVTLNRFDDAERFLLDAQSALQRTGEARAVRIKTVKKLVDLYTTWNKPDEAATWSRLLKELDTPPDKK